MRPGCKADLTLIDPNALRVDEKTPDARPGGIAHVYVNGAAVLKDGIYRGGRHSEIAQRK